MSSMRRQLAGLVAVTTSLVLLAFLIPLAIVLRHNAADRGIAAATDAAQSTAALIAVDPDTAPGINGRLDDGLTLSVFLGDGTVYGEAGSRTPSVELASRGRAFSAASGPGVEVLVPVQGMPGGTAVVRAYAAPSLLNRGVTRTWLILAALGAALFALGLILADRLGRRLTTAVSALAGTADRLAAGDLEARVTPDGPNEIRRVGEELNRLASRIGELLTAEREEVADLAHRLRTPVAALRLDADSIRSDVDRDRVGADVDYLTRVVDEVIRTARRPVREGAGASADLAKVARDRVAFWTPLAEDDGRTLTLAVPDQPVLVRVAIEDLATAVDGLLQNVFAHTTDGVDATVNVTADGVLTVADTGGGFTDVPERGVSAVSTGLGLDIARRTAEASGGGMTIGRSSAGGAEVTLRFGAA